MNIQYDGAVPKMHKTKLVDGCIGDFECYFKKEHKLRLDQWQWIIWDSKEEGPIVMQPSERLLLWEDQKQIKFKNKSRQDLRPKLVELQLDPTYVDNIIMNSICQICR